MKIYLILSLVIAVLSLVGAITLLIKGKGSEAKLTVAAILGGLALFMVMLALCLGFFMR